ncbi:MAG: glycosyltransferase family 39 protein, partial [Victivallaceae bacterium]
MLSLLVSCFGVDLYRDSAGVYSFMARELYAGNYEKAFHPSIPCLNVLLSWGFSVINLAPERAIILISSLFYVGTVFFIYKLMRNFFSLRLAEIGALLFACAPKIIRFSCTGLIDSGKIFFFVLAIYLLLEFIKKNFSSFSTAIYLGLALGGLSLSRSEAIGNVMLIFFMMFCIYILLVLKKQKPSIWAVMLCGVFWAITCVIRMLINYFSCGKFIFDQRLSSGVNSKIAQLFQSFHATPSPAQLAAPAQNVEPINSALADYLDCLGGFVRGSYEFYLLLTLLGGLLLYLFTRSKIRVACEKNGLTIYKWDWRYLILLISVAGNLIIFKLSMIYAYRYFLINIALLMPFILIALSFFFELFSKKINRKVLCVIFSVILGLQVLNGITPAFDSKGVMVKKTGIFIGQLIASDNPKVLFIKHSPEWYYSETERALPLETPRPDLETF